MNITRCVLLTNSFTNRLLIGLALLALSDLNASASRPCLTQRCGVVQTGGTIAMHEDHGIRKNSDGPWLKVAATHAAALTQRVFNGSKDSSQILSTDLPEILGAVQNQLKKGVVPIITHGTDTLATTGMILSQTFPDELIVMTGAFRPENIKGSDAVTNYRDAVLLAETALASGAPRTPYVVMNDKVYLASNLVKLDTDFTNGRRGFQSFQSEVATITKGKIKWKSDFLKSFEESRLRALKETGTLRRKIQVDLQQGKLALARVEIGFVNEHTPTNYITSLLDRLEQGMSEGLVLQGRFPTNPQLLNRALNLKTMGRPVYIQSLASTSQSNPLHFPKGLEPFQLQEKMSLWVRYSKDPKELDQLLSANLAGEVASRPISGNLKADIPPGDFYESKDVSRSFVIYQSDLSLMSASLKSEIARLKSRMTLGKKAELIVEGVGNGHIYVGPEAQGSPSLLQLLAQARQDGIQITITTRVKDAQADARYEVGQRLQASDISAQYPAQPGRGYLEHISR